MAPTPNRIAVLGTTLALAFTGTAAASHGAPHKAIKGTPGADTITGTPGKDVIFAGKGADTIDAGAGDDHIFVRDGEKDTVTCGDGRDVVLADAIDVIAPDCEKVIVKKPKRHHAKPAGKHGTHRHHAPHVAS